MKVLGIITSPTEASARARILQYEGPLKKEDIELKPKYYYPLRYSEPAPWFNTMGKITRISPWRFLHIHKIIRRLPLLISQYKYDIIWQNRLIMPHHSFLERALSKPIAFDFDDAIWISDNKKAVDKVLQRSSIVFAGNEYLAEYALKYNQQTIVIPSVIDTTLLFHLKKEDQYFTIGWIGTITNFKFLELAKPAINKFISLNKEVRLIIVSSEPPPQFDFDNKRYIFKKWEASRENELINEFSIGLMPIEDNEFTRGKCSYKMLQYMACGKPVVVSPVGTNKKILNEAEVGLAANTTEEWLNAFTILKTDYGFYKNCAANGRALVESNFSIKTTTPLIIENFKKII